MRNKLRHKGEQRLKYNLNKWKKKVAFDIINDVSENFTLVQLLYTLVTVNRAISIVGYWIFDSNYEQTLCLTRKSLDLICSTSVGEEQVLNFETFFYADRFVWSS